MTVYIVVVFAVTYAFRHFHLNGPLTYILAVMPAIPVTISVIQLGLYLTQEPDEFVRAILIQCSLWASGLVLTLCTFWGFLETYVTVPTVPMYWVYVVWMATFGLSKPIVLRRYR